MNSLGVIPGDGASLGDRPAVAYRGHRTEAGLVVVLEDDRGGVRPLPPRLDLRRHSPAGFEWGYGGSGPAQLALALLADAIGEEHARAFYQDFKHEVVAGLQNDNWELSRAELIRWHQTRAV